MVKVSVLCCTPRSPRSKWLKLRLQIIRLVCYKFWTIFTNVNIVHPAYPKYAAIPDVPFHLTKLFCLAISGKRISLYAHPLYNIASSLNTPRKEGVVKYIVFYTVYQVRDSDRLRLPLFCLYKRSAFSKRKMRYFGKECTW